MAIPTPVSPAVARMSSRSAPGHQVAVAGMVRSMVSATVVHRALSVPPPPDGPHADRKQRRHRASADRHAGRSAMPSCRRASARSSVKGLSWSMKPPRNGAGLEVGAVDADEHHVPVGAVRAVRTAHHLELDGHRALADPPDVGGHGQVIVQARRVVELGVDLHPGEEDVVLVEHRPEREAGGAEELRLRQLEEPDVGPVEDDAREVHVGPADVLFDDEWGRHGGR